MISDRLSAVLSMVKAAQVLADIGTDHAYVPVAACLQGLTQRAIACDINPGPLAKAVHNINAHRLAHRIETRLGDGLTPLAVGEADCIVVAGMGGMRIADILAGAPETAHAAGRLLLQPQHDIPRLRRILHQRGFDITDEVMLREDGHFYTVLAVQSCVGSQRQAKDRDEGRKESQEDERRACWTETEYLLGRHLLLRKDPALYAFLQHEMVKLTGYIDRITARRSASAQAQQPESLATLRTRFLLYKEMCDAW